MRPETVSEFKSLGEMVQVTIERAVPVGAAGVRLAATNPVFVAWGPTGDQPGANR